MSVIKTKSLSQNFPFKREICATVRDLDSEVSWSGELGMENRPE